MKKKHCYQVLAKKNRYLYGAFPRTPIGKRKARAYQAMLLRKQKVACVIK